MERNNDLISRSALLEGLREYYGCMGACEECGCTAGKLIMNAPAVTEKAQWIPVTERLPKGECIAFGYQGEMIMGYLGIEAWAERPLYYAENEGEYLYDVTHWMPIPEPPKEDAE